MFLRPAAPSQSCCCALNILWKAGITWGKAHVTFCCSADPGSMFKKYRIGACMGGTMNSIDWRSTILRWGAVALSLFWCANFSDEDRHVTPRGKVEIRRRCI